MKGIGTDINTAHVEYEGFAHEEYSLGNLIELAFDSN